MMLEMEYIPRSNGKSQGLYIGNKSTFQSGDLLNQFIWSEWFMEENSKKRKVG